MRNWLKWLKDLAGGGAHVPVLLVMAVACAADPVVDQPTQQATFAIDELALSQAWQPLYFGTPASGWVATASKAEFRFTAQKGGTFQLQVAAGKPMSSIELKLYKQASPTPGSNSVKWSYVKSAASKSGSTFVTNTPVSTGTYRAVVDANPKEQGITATLTCQKGTCAVGGQIGSACGSRGLQPCAAGLFCKWQAGDLCGATDKPGTCAVKPQICPMVYMPVCGCDGKTYGNACAAASAGQGVMSNGACCSDTTFKPAAITSGELGGAWGDVKDGKHPTTYTFKADGSFAREDIVSLCPKGAVCIWSGIATSGGTWKIAGTTVQLTWKNKPGFDIAVPTALQASKKCLAWQLSELGGQAETFAK